MEKGKEEDWSGKRKELQSMAVTDYPSFIRVAIQLNWKNVLPEKGRFRFRDARSHNFEDLQRIYGVSGPVNASLFRHTVDFIAMEYPTERTRKNTERMIRDTGCCLVISLLGDQHTQETDYLADLYRLRVRCTLGELVPGITAAASDISGLGGCGADNGLLIELYDAKKMQEGKNTGKPLQLLRIRCTSWKDKTAPTLSLLESLCNIYTAAVRALGIQASRSPVIVHCMAGVGRTGTFIFYVMMKDRLKEAGQLTKKERVSVFIDLFLYLRERRSLMIETPEQLDFLFRVFIEAPEAA